MSQAYSLKIIGPNRVFMLEYEQMPKINSRKFTLKIPRKSLPFNWDYNLTYYVFHPTVVEGRKLVRLYETPSKKLVLLKVGYDDGRLLCELLSYSKVDDKDLGWARELVVFMFALKEEVSEFYNDICKKDPVLKAASKQIYGAHLRRDETVFESIIGVIVAQNVYFKRVYKMLELLCTKFGKSKKFFRNTYYTFPDPEVLANAKIEDIRSCAVGYRDKYIKSVAEKIVKENIDVNNLRKLSDIDEIRNKLIELPGVGPYTADLVIAISFEFPSFHLDLFSREALYTFYFKGKKVTDEQLRQFVEKKWGKWKHYVMLALTTNTDEWAKDLGVNFRLKSAAKND